MINKKKLLEVYSNARGDNNFYTFEDFSNDAKSYIKDIKKRNVVMSMTVSRSGMTRHFNSLKYNMLLNICYNNKYSWDSVKVGGCGMDMHWYLLYRACEDLLGHDKANSVYNGLCSGQPLL